MAPADAQPHSVFRSVRFKFKILFHKNKEVKGTLSKKMAFSLMRLITIFALAFVASSAMAQFATVLSVEDVSYAADNQIERSADNQIERGEVMVSVTEVVVSVTFGKSVDISTVAAKVALRTTNEFGGLIANLDADPASADPESADPASVGAQVVAVAHKYPHRVDGQNFTLTFLVDATARVATVKNDIPYKSVFRVAEVPAIAIGDYGNKRGCGYNDLLCGPSSEYRAETGAYCVCG